VANFPEDGLDDVSAAGGPHEDLEGVWLEASSIPSDKLGPGPKPMTREEVKPQTADHDHKTGQGQKQAHEQRMER